MKLFRPFAVSCFLLLTFMSSVYARSDYQVKLHIIPDPGTKNYIKNICIISKIKRACGNNKSLNHLKKGTLIKIFQYNSAGHFLGFDDSCKLFRVGDGYRIDKDNGTLDIYTTLHQDIVNHIAVMAITNCSYAEY